MRYIAIDIGSTYWKAALVELESGLILEKRKYPSPGRLPSQDHFLFEVPAKEYEYGVKEIIDGYTQRYSGIGGVVLATQMHGFIYQTVQEPDTYVSWQDRRCLHQFLDTKGNYLSYLREILPQEVMTPCGVGLKPSLGICNLYTMLSENSSMRRDGRLHTLGSYVIQALTGNYICHPTNAAPLGIYDLIFKKWNTALLKRLGLASIELPKVAESDGEICGSYNSNHQELKVFSDYGDQQVSILGCGNVEGSAVVNIATASQVSVVTESIAPGDYETRPFFFNRYIRTVSNMPGGRGLEVLVHFVRDMVKETCGYELTDQAIWEKVHDLQLKDAGGLEMDMDFFAEPGAVKNGVIRGIRTDNLRLETLFAAAFRHMAQTYWENIQKITDAEALRQVICAGGVAWKTPELLREMGRVSGRPCGRSLSDDESLEGLLQIARHCESRSWGNRP